MFVFMMQSLQWLILCMDNQELEDNFDDHFYVLFYSIIKVKHFFYWFIILIHLIFLILCIFSLLIPYKNWFCFLSFLTINAILLTSSVNTICFLFLSLAAILILIYCFLWILYDFLFFYRLSASGVFFKVVYFLFK